MKTILTRFISIAAMIGVLLVYNNAVYANEEEEAALLAEYEEAMAEINAAQESSYNDGTYTGEAWGFGGTITMEVVIEDGTITEVNVLSAESEDSAYLAMAVDVIDDILSTQSADVDTVSGATFSSNGIIEAVELALESAKK